MSDENQLVRTKPDREYFLDLVSDGIDPKRAAELAGYSSRYEARRLIRDNAPALQSRLWVRLAGQAGKAVSVLADTMDADSHQTRYLGARDLLDRLGMSAGQSQQATSAQDHETLRVELERQLGPEMVATIADRALGVVATVDADSTDPADTNPT